MALLLRTCYRWLDNGHGDCADLDNHACEDDHGGQDDNSDSDDYVDHDAEADQDKHGHWTKL